MEKSAVFIDGAYLNKILKNCFNKREIDYLKLCDFISEKLELTRIRTYFYHCLPLVRGGNKEDEYRHSNMQRFISNIKRLPRFEIKLGKLQLIGGQFRQKMVDVLMSLDIVDICANGKVQQIIILAGDSDFVPAIKKAKDCGIIVHLFYHPSSIHNELLDEVDESHVLSEELLNLCSNQKR
jgi:uncharacterized LabA/DUF88 family protein